MASIRVDLLASSGLQLIYVPLTRCSLRLMVQRNHIYQFEEKGAFVVLYFIKWLNLTVCLSCFGITATAAAVL